MHHNAALAPSFRNQRGVALVLVLWLSVLLTITAGSYTIAARTETLQARYLLDQTRARYAAEAALHRAAFELRNPDELTRWKGDGRIYSFNIDDIVVDLQLIDESGKIDVNVANTETLDRLFQSVGIEDEQHRMELVDAVQDFIDPDDTVRLNGAEFEAYEAAGLPYGPKNANLDTVPEFQQILGITYDLYEKIEPSITVYSGRGEPNPAYAQRGALLTLPDMTPDLVDDFIQQREQSEEAGQGPLLPDGTTVVPRGGGLTYSVRARATLPNDTWTYLEATIRLGNGLSGRPFRIVRWRDGTNSS